MVVDKIPSGYYTDSANLVPCCGKCNQSKGAKFWYDYMNIANYITVDNSKKFINNCRDEDIDCFFRLLQADVNNLTPEGQKEALRGIGIYLTKEELKCYIKLVGANDKNPITKKNLNREYLLTILSSVIDEANVPINYDKVFSKDCLKRSLLKYHIERSLKEIKDNLVSYLKCISCDYHDTSCPSNFIMTSFLNKYLEFVIGNTEKLDSKERILRRLLVSDDENKEVKCALKTSFNRFYTLRKYCEDNNFPLTKEEESQKLSNRLMITIGDNTITEWWIGMYNAIKDSLDSAQIQIEAFNAGIKFAVEGKKTSFDDYFKELLKDEKSLSDNSEALENNTTTLQAIGFNLNNDRIVFESSAKTIYDKAEIAFKMGYNYYQNNKTEQEKLKRLYASSNNDNH